MLKLNRTTLLTLFLLCTFAGRGQSIPIIGEVGPECMPKEIAPISAPFEGAV